MLQPTTCPACQGSRYADYAAVPCELCCGSGVKPRDFKEPRRWFLKPNGQEWRWRYYSSVWSWLRHDVILYWRCCQCGKRHLSSRHYWEEHIDFDAPLCTKCQDAVWESYNAYMRGEQARIVSIDADWYEDMGS